jgi:phage baseplate assembly protein W
MSINIRFPFRETNRGGVFEANNTTPNALREDLISLLTTKRGQRPMRSTLFSPIYDYIMEPMDELTKKELQIAIEEKVQEFIPQITITKINYFENFENNILTIEIVFRIDTSFGVKDSIILNIPRNNDSLGPDGNLIIN